MVVKILKELVSDYVKEYDMTFILFKNGNQMEAKGFYFGEPDEKLIHRYNGKMKADFGMSTSEYSDDYVVNTIAVYSEKYNITFIMTDSNLFLELSGVYAGKPNKSLNCSSKGNFLAISNKKRNNIYWKNSLSGLLKR